MSEPKLTKLQAFEILRLHRSVIKGAGYNPRKIEPHERKRLTALVRKLGMLAPITVNATTGYTLVGGHQRLAILDAYEKTEDYLLDVAVVKLTPEQERTANVGLNNPNSMGGFDLDKLEAMMRDDAVKMDIDLAGYARIDVEDMFGVAFFGGIGDMLAASDTVHADVIAEVEAMAPLKDVAPTKTQIAIANRAKMKVDISASTSTDTYVMIVFQTKAEVDAFTDWAGYPRGEAFLNGPRVMKRLKND